MSDDISQSSLSDDSSSPSEMDLILSSSNNNIELDNLSHNEQQDDLSVKPSSSTVSSLENVEKVWIKIMSLLRHIQVWLKLKK